MMKTFRSWMRAAGVPALAVLLAVSCSRSPTQSAPDSEPAAGDSAPAGGRDLASKASSIVGRAPAAIGGSPSIVILQPLHATEFPPQSGPPFMDQISLTFVPAILPVRTGQPAEFRNSDDVLHNVRVRNEDTKEPAFNVAIPTGGTYRHTFDRDGFYDVGCDIHPGMAAVVVSSSTPFVTLADRNGSFAFDAVPPGSYRLSVYAGAARIERRVDVAGGETKVDAATP